MMGWMGKRAGFPLVVSGPSGVGKTSLVNRLLDSDAECVRSVSATTRPMRQGETDGESYTFLSETHFNLLRDRGGLAEWAQYGGAWYGTPREALDARLARGLCVVLNIEVQGGFQVRSGYPSAVLVFVVPPSWEELRSRLLGRGTDSAESIEARIRRGHEEIEEAARYDFVIVNDDLDRCAADLRAIVRAERRRASRLRGGDGETP